MMAFTKFIEPVAVEIVMDNLVDVEVVVEIMVDIAVAAASEATTVVIGAAAAVVLEGAGLLAPVDLTKRKLQQSGSKRQLHCHKVFILQSYLVALALDHFFGEVAAGKLQPCIRHIGWTFSLSSKLHDTWMECESLGA